jgi:hypothetical protein
VATQTADEHRTGQAALVSLIPALLRQAWPLLDLHNLQGTMPAFTAAVKAIVARYGKASAAGALDYYRVERQAASMPGRASMKMAPTPADSVIESAVSWATTDLFGPVTAQGETKALDRLDTAVSQLVLDQGRDTIIAAVASDKAAKGWARVTEPGACSFCTMLALRAGSGLLYYSKRGADFRSHDNCRCHVEPVFTAYEPSAHMREMQKLWDSSTKGRSGVDARNAFRQAMEGRPVTGTTGAKKARALLSGTNMDRPQVEFLLKQAQGMPDSPWRTKQIARLSKLLA